MRVIDVRQRPPYDFEHQTRRLYVLAAKDDLAGRRDRLRSHGSTAHANGPRHLLWHLETMAMMSDVDLPAAHIRNQVASAIDVVVRLARLRDGRRVVWEVAAVEGTRRGEPVVTLVIGPDGRILARWDNLFTAEEVTASLDDLIRIP